MVQNELELGTELELELEKSSGAPGTSVSSQGQTSTPSTYNSPFRFIFGNMGTNNANVFAKTVLRLFA
jgi:hypothetical protein